MPFPPGGGPRRIPVTREIVSTEFERADGQVDGHAQFAKVVGPSPAADVDSQVVQRKVELACGCFWPDVEVGGVCGVCAGAGKTANVCKQHYAVCSCGAACCWFHSRPTDDPAVRLCERCNLRKKNESRKATAVALLRSAAKRLFASERPDDGAQP